MIKIYLIKKEKGRIYKSADIVRSLFGFTLLHDDEGAPKLAEDDACYISISDSKNYWACALEDHPIGIDLEELSRTVRPTTTRKFHKDEQEYLAALSEGGREWKEEFFSIWTKKEAYSKLCGKGLSIGFSKFSVLEDNVEGAPIGSFVSKGLMFGFAGDDGAFAVEEKYDAPIELSALDYAAGLLDVKGYSASELAKKLVQRGYKEDEIELAIDKLKDYGYVNDEAYAKSIARRGAESGKGSRRIELELARKGIEKQLAKDTAAEHKGSEYERALEIAKKIYEKAGLPKTRPENEEEKKDYYERRRKLSGKISRKLASLGHDAGVIYAVLEDVVK